MPGQLIDEAALLRAAPLASKDTLSRFGAFAVHDLDGDKRLLLPVFHDCFDRGQVLAGDFPDSDHLNGQKNPQHQGYHLHQTGEDHLLRQA